MFPFQELGDGDKNATQIMLFYLSISGVVE